MQFNYRICYRPGKKNIVADVLSRKNEVILTQKKIRVQKKIRTVLELVRMVIFTLKNIESINITVKMVRKNRESPTLLKEC